jgi:hypothetical protein
MRSNRDSNTTLTWEVSPNDAAQEDVAMKIFRADHAVTASATAAVVLTATACSGGGTAGSPGQDVVTGGSLTVGISADPGNLDPQRSVNGPNLLMAVFGYDTPVTLLCTGLTRDGVYLVEDGRVRGAVHNFRFNESPVDLLGRVTEAGRTEPALPSERGDLFRRTAMPPIGVPDFNM